MKEELQEICGMIENILRENKFSYPDEEALIIADKILNLGYHKTVWHKVADGDLPEYAGSYLVVCGDESLPEYNVDFYENYKGGKRWVHNEGRVITWTETPKYKE